MQEEETEQDALWRMAGELEFAISIENLPEAISNLEQSNIVTALELRLPQHYLDQALEQLIELSLVTQLLKQMQRL